MDGNENKPAHREYTQDESSELYLIDLQRAVVDAIFSFCGKEIDHAEALAIIADYMEILESEEDPNEDTAKLIADFNDVYGEKFNNGFKKNVFETLKDYFARAYGKDKGKN